MNFEDMNIVELAEFYIEDLKKDPSSEEEEGPVLDDRTEWGKWQGAFRGNLKKATLVEKIAVLSIWRDLDFTLEEELLTMESLRDEIVGEPLRKIDARLTKIEQSLYILLKKFEGDCAEITVGQLNSLKGGIDL